ncbi:MAG: serine/threonine protein kinase, partial [Victivallales bacterium]|nr:serine/threonine protein kinase [Victivallales bacterium]
MDKLGIYILGENIGSGAMGSVCKATAPDGSVVAIKTLYPHLASIDEFVRRFKREAGLATKLSHPNVVKVLDQGEEKGTYYIVMEYVDGKSLSEIMHEKGLDSASLKKSDATQPPGNAEPQLGAAPENQKQSDAGASHSKDASHQTPLVKYFPPDEVIKIMRQIAGVLHAAGDIGLVHRDIKPQNILIDKKGNAKLLDFGLAKDTEAMVSMLSMTGQTIGTPPYMAPEQHAATEEEWKNLGVLKGHTDVRSDLYSLGATGYHLLTGHAPFPGPSASAYSRQHIEEIPKPANKVNKDIPLNLSQVIDRLLAKKPAKRHQKPAELIEDLNRVERGEVP